MLETGLDQQATLPHSLKPKRYSFTSEAAKAARAKRRDRPTIPTTGPTPSHSIDEIYKSGIQEWIAIAAHFRKDIRKAQQVGDKKAIVAVMTAAGIAWDKAFPKRAEDQQPIVTPQIVVENMVKLVSPSLAPVPINPTTPETPVDAPTCNALPLSES